jgi:hypothetical protein
MKNIERICKTCDKSFLADKREINRNNAKYCSLSCAAKVDKQLQFINSCKQCSNQFTTSCKNTKYCSNICKQKNYRLKQKEQTNDYVSIKYFYKLFKDIPCEICQWNKASRDLHHIINVSNGGSNTLDNIICVCPNCHRMIHQNFISEDSIKIAIENRTISSSLESLLINKI